MEDKFDKLVCGTVVVDKYSDEYTVISFLGDEIIFLANDEGDGYDWLTKTEFNKPNWKIKGEAEELTVEEVSKKLGYEVKIVR